MPVRLNESVAILLSVQNLEKSYGSQTLFQGLQFSIETGERIGLIGPNGAGKSTLLKILAGEARADHGEVVFSKGLRVGYLDQDPSFASGASILSAVVGSDDWETAAERLGLAHEWLARLDILTDGRRDDTPIEQLSGGWRKRVALARELMKEPDLLILDEPTNHLDLESILWLEDLLESARFATLTVTHDRMFLQRVAKRILDLDRRNPNGLISIKGTYADYLDAKENLMNAQVRKEEVARNTLRRETEWLRRGAKARTTKQVARIERAEDLGREVEELSARNLNRSARIDFQTAERNPQRLIEAKGVSQSYDGHTLFAPMDILITPRSRVGLLGPNGSGKSTLIRILIGEEKPTTGEIKRADKLQIAYFAQHRVELNPKLSVLKTLVSEGDYVEFKGQRIFARSYLSRFLFRSEQMDMPVEKLSGGEKARLRIAQLMLISANVLVLDEPTNDLDMQTLEVLEASLKEFDGAVILVTHDRYFLDQVANELLAFVVDDKGDKRIERFADTLQWEDWLRRSQTQRIQGRRAGPAAAAASAQSDPLPSSVAEKPEKRKLSFKEKRELDGMENVILQAEARLDVVKSEIASPEVVSNATRLTELTRELAELEKRIEELYARWAELSS